MSSDLKSIFYQFNFNMINYRTKKIYEFENFHLDAAHLILYQNGQEILLAPKVIETLLALVEHCGEVLSKDELMEIIWSDSIVEESNLTQNFYLLRKILQKTVDGKPFIQTLKRRGYRFNSDVLCVESKTAKVFSHHLNGARQNDIPLLNGHKKDNYQPQTSELANAFQNYQLSRLYFHQFTAPSIMKSRNLLDEAIRLDENFAPAYAALAENCLFEGIYGIHSLAESFVDAKNALRRAFNLSPNSAEIYAAAGFVDLICDWNFAGAKRNLQKSLQINSHCAFANNYLGQAFLFQCRFDEAINYLKRSVEIEPMGLFNRGLLLQAYFLAKEYQKAIEECENILALNPKWIVAATMRCWILEQTGKAAEAVIEYERLLNEPGGEFVRRWIGYAYALVGDEENARKSAAMILAESRDHFVSPTHLTAIYAALNEPDNAIFYLENALALHDPWLLWIAADPRFNNLRTDSRFKKLENLVVGKTVSDSCQFFESRL